MKRFRLLLCLSFVLLTCACPVPDTPLSAFERVLLEGNHDELTVFIGGHDDDLDGVDDDGPDACRWPSATTTATFQGREMERFAGSIATGGKTVSAQSDFGAPGVSDEAAGCNAMRFWIDGVGLEEEEEEVEIVIDDGTDEVVVALTHPGLLGEELLVDGLGLEAEPAARVLLPLPTGLELLDRVAVGGLEGSPTSAGLDELRRELSLQAPSEPGAYPFSVGVAAGPQMRCSGGPACEVITESPGLRVRLEGTLHVR